MADVSYPVDGHLVLLSKYAVSDIPLPSHTTKTIRTIWPSLLSQECSESVSGSTSVVLWASEQLWAMVTGSCLHIPVPVVIRSSFPRYGIHLKSRESLL